MAGSQDGGGSGRDSGGRERERERDAVEVAKRPFYEYGPVRRAARRDERGAFHLS